AARGAAVLIATQCAVLASSACALLVLAARDVAKRRDTAAVVLMLWIFGVFAFATFVNWTINGRTVLLMTPAVAIAIARGVERGSSRARRPWGVGLGVPLAAAAAIALAVVAADARWADSSRRAARDLSATYEAPQRHPWFMGHWGFQYYMEEH